MSISTVVRFKDISKKFLKECINKLIIEEIIIRKSNRNLNLYSVKDQCTVDNNNYCYYSQSPPNHVLFNLLTPVTETEKSTQSAKETTASQPSTPILNLKLDLPKADINQIEISKSPQNKERVRKSS